MKNGKQFGSQKSFLANNDEVLRMVLDEKASIIVKRDGDGFPNHFTDIVGAELFHGHENPFQYS